MTEAYVLTRDLTLEEMNWGSALYDLKRGSVVYKFVGPVRDSVDGFTATIDALGVGKYFVLPYDAIERKIKVSGPYNANGDLVATEGMVFRQVGWQINGGHGDGMIIKGMDEKKLKSVLGQRHHGGYSPVYVAVGRD